MVLSAIITGKLVPLRLFSTCRYERCQWWENHVENLIIDTARWSCTSMKHRPSTPDAAPSTWKSSKIISSYGVFWHNDGWTSLTLYPVACVQCILHDDGFYEHFQSTCLMNESILLNTVSITCLVPGALRLLPLNSRGVCSPLTTATGETEKSSGVLQALNDLHRRIFPTDKWGLAEN